MRKGTRVLQRVAHGKLGARSGPRTESTHSFPSRSDVLVKPVTLVNFIQMSQVTTDD